MCRWCMYVQPAHGHGAVLRQSADTLPATLGNREIREPHQRHCTVCCVVFENFANAGVLLCCPMSVCPAPKDLMPSRGKDDWRPGTLPLGKHGQPFAEGHQGAEGAFSNSETDITCSRFPTHEGVPCQGLVRGPCCISGWRRIASCLETA